MNQYNKLCAACGDFARKLIPNGESKNEALSKLTDSSDEEISDCESFTTANSDEIRDTTLSRDLNKATNVLDVVPNSTTVRVNSLNKAKNVLDVVPNSTTVSVNSINKVGERQPSTLTEGNLKIFEQLGIARERPSLVEMNFNNTSQQNNVDSVKPPFLKKILESRLQPSNGNQVNKMPTNQMGSADQLYSFKRSDSNRLKNTSARPWLKPMQLPNKTEIEVTVLFIDDKSSNKIWVMESKHSSAASQLLMEIKKYTDSIQTAIPEKDVQKDALVLAPFDNIYYRGQIVFFIPLKKTAKIRLIDYGNDFFVKYSELRSPIPYMKNINAFAFEINVNTPVIVGDKLKIKSNSIRGSGTISNNETNNIIKSKCEQSILSTLSVYSNVRIVGILGEKNAIGIYTDSDFDEIHLKMNKMLSDHTKYILNKQPIEGDYVAAVIQDHGFQRAFILGIHNVHYLVYCVDIGKIFRTIEIKMIPSKLSILPFRSIILQIQKLTIKESELMKKINESTTFNVKPIVNINDKILPCRLFDGNKEVGQIKAFVWDGDLKVINLDMFYFGLMSNDIVKITHIVDCTEVFVSISTYNFLLQDAIKTSEQYEYPQIMEIVLINKNNSVFRAQILEDTNDDKFSVQNIDSGCTEIVKKESIYVTNTLIKNLPCYAKRLKLASVDRAAKKYDNQPALIWLNRYKDYGTSFLMKFDETHDNQIHLHFVNNKKISLNEQLVEILMKGDDKCADVVSPVIISDVSSPDIKYTMKDIEKLPLNIGKRESIHVLDISNLKNGYFTGCAPNTDWPTKMAKVYTPAFDAHCSRGDIEGEYSPILNEVCFVVDDNDHWCRGLCREKCWNKDYVITLIDFGYKMRVDKTKIRQMREKFLYHTAANTCYLKDVTDFNKLKTSIVPGQNFLASIEKDENNLYFICLL